MAAVTLSPFPTTAMTTQRPAAIACLKSGIVNGSGLSDDRAAALGEAAAAQVERYAPGAPQAAKNEAVVRLAGWLHSVTPRQHRRASVGGDIAIQFSPLAADGFRHSGARAMLSAWRVRRALAVEAEE